MSAEPTSAEIRCWAQGLGLPVPDRGVLPQGVIDRWNREHPDRPSAKKSGTAGWKSPAFTPRDRLREAGLRGAASRHGGAS